MLAARRPRDPIGWLLLAFILAAANPADLYVYLDYRMHHGTLPLGGVAVVLGGALPIGVLIAILLWVFPDGHLPPGRWRPVFTALAVAGVLLGLVAGLVPGIAAVASHHIRGLASGNLNPPTGVGAVIANVTNIAAVVSLLAWLVVQVPGYRRSGDERRLNAGCGGHSSIRCANGCSTLWTGGSTGLVTSPTGSWTPSLPG